MARRRISPDRWQLHGHHIDEWWPGLVHSTWSFFTGKVKIIRERKYHEANHKGIKAVSYEARLRIGTRTTVGFKVQRLAPRSDHW